MLLSGQLVTIEPNGHTDRSKFDVDEIVIKLGDNGLVITHDEFSGKLRLTWYGRSLNVAPVSDTQIKIGLE